MKKTLQKEANFRGHLQIQILAARLSSELQRTVCNHYVVVQIGKTHYNTKPVNSSCAEWNDDNSFVLYAL